MRSLIWARYAGQQKFTASTVTPPPAPPALLRPNPWPRTCGEDLVVPSFGFSPVAAVLLLASGGAVVGLAASGRVRALGSGTDIVGGVGAGAVSARRTGSSGGGVWTARLPICVMPPVRGPGAPPRLMVITVRGGAAVGSVGTN